VTYDLNAAKAKALAAAGVRRDAVH
jgi:hypothetical protein